MAFARIAGGSAGSTIGGTTGLINAAGANLGILVPGWFAGGITNVTVTDSNLNTWTNRSHTLSSTPFGLDIWDCQGTFTNAMTVSVTAGNTFFCSFGVQFYSGAASTAFDAAVAAAGSGHQASLQPGNLTSPGNGYLRVVGNNLTDNQTSTLPTCSGFTLQQSMNWLSGNYEGFELFDLIESAAQTLNPTVTGFNGTLENIVAQGLWAPASAPPATVFGSTLSMMGVG